MGNLLLEPTITVGIPNHPRFPFPLAFPSVRGRQASHRRLRRTMAPKRPDPPAPSFDGGEASSGGEDVGLEEEGMEQNKPPTPAPASAGQEGDGEDDEEGSGDEEADSDQATKASLRKKKVAATDPAAPSKRKRKAPPAQTAASPQPKKKKAAGVAKSPKRKRKAAGDVAKSPRRKKKAAGDAKAPLRRNAAAAAAIAAAELPKPPSPAAAEDNSPHVESNPEKLLEEKINSYHHLWVAVLALQAKLPGMSLKDVFLKITDAKAAKLNTKLKNHNMALVKQQTKMWGIKKKVAKALVDLAE